MFTPQNQGQNIKIQLTRISVCFRGGLPDIRPQRKAHFSAIRLGIKFTHYHVLFLDVQSFFVAIRFNSVPSYLILLSNAGLSMVENLI
jgi:hypothetical protein